MSQASLYTILNNVTTKTYVTGITIYNTLTRFIVTTKTYVTGITIYNTHTIHCNHQNLCHRHHYIQYSTNVTTKTYVTGITIYNTLTRFIVTTKTYVMA